MKVKVNDAVGSVLDWLVAKCEGMIPDNYAYFPANKEYTFHPSTDWSQGGLIVEREKIDIKWSPANIECFATITVMWPAELPCGLRSVCRHATTSLIAAMRCYVASQLGDEVEVPGELA
jgi:hypothetical protein